MVTVFKIVYNTVSNSPLSAAWPKTGHAIQIEEMMVGKPAKRSAVRAAKARQPMPSRPREPAAAIIAKRIEEDIVLGRRQPRERLVEQDLCDLFQTHRGDVRLALFELEKKGLVGRIPNRGALVRGLTPREVREIYAVREELEVMAVRIIPFPVETAAIERFGKSIGVRANSVDLLRKQIDGLDQAGIAAQSEQKLMETQVAVEDR